MEKITIYVADDHNLFRQAIIKLIKDFKRVGKVKEAANGKELLHIVREEIPDVVVLDLEMPVMDGVKTCEKLAREFPEVKIIILSMHDGKREIYHLLQLGAHAFLSKNAESEELEFAIHSLMEKGIYRNKMMTEALKSCVNTLQSAVKINKTKVALSSREYSIVALLCKEFTNRQIGIELSLSQNTVRNHKVRIMRKAGVKNTPGLVKYAFQHGLVNAVY